MKKGESEGKTERKRNSREGGGEGGGEGGRRGGREEGREGGGERGREESQHQKGEDCIFIIIVALVHLQQYCVSNSLILKLQACVFINQRMFVLPVPPGAATYSGM